MIESKVIKGKVQLVQIQLETRRNYTKNYRKKRIKTKETRVDRA